MKFKIWTNAGYVRSATFAKNNKSIQSLSYTYREDMAWEFTEDTIFIARACYTYLQVNNPEAKYTETRYVPRHLGYYLKATDPYVTIRADGEREYSFRLTPNANKALSFTEKKMPFPLPVEWEERPVEFSEPLQDLLARCR